MQRPSKGYCVSCTSNILTLIFRMVCNGQRRNNMGLELLLAIEEEFGLDIPDRDAEKQYTVGT